MLARVFACTLALAVPCGAAQAGRPFFTEDAEVLQPGECEWEAVHLRGHERGQARSTEQSLQLGCRVAAAALQAQLALVRGPRGEHGRTSGEVGLKWGLPTTEDSPWRVALALRAAAQDDEAGRRRVESGDLRAVVSGSLSSRWTAHGHLGSALQRGAKPVALWATALEHALTERWMLGAEVYRDEERRRWAGLVGRWQAGEAWSLDVSVARRRGGVSEAAIGAKGVF